MTKKGIICFVFSVLMVAYLVIGITFAAAQDAHEPYGALNIRVENSASTFVTPQEIDHELGDLSKRISSLPADSINTQQIEDCILALDNIEEANCVVLNNRQLLLDVTPLTPVARIFDTAEGNSYYINRQGKRMQASLKYRIDVPVITGNFSGRARPTDAIPLLDYIAQHPDLGSLVTAIHIQRNGDIFLIPRTHGHVINFGDTQDMDNKFERLRVFYREAMPVKGWQYYDTISVKWRGQVVAKRRVAKLPVNILPEEDEDDIDDVNTITG